MTHGRWFLPDEPDVLGMLRRQTILAVEGMEAFAAWADGDQRAADVVRQREHDADVVKRELRTALREAFVTPLEPEDLFALSRSVDWLLNHAKDAIGEAEVMDCAPDDAIAEMAALLAEAVRHLDMAVAVLAKRDGELLQPADAAVKAERRLERAYRAAMAALLDVDDLRVVMARRELYRRCSRIGDTIIDVAERVEYALVKEG